MDLLARLLYLHPQTPSRRVRLSTEAERDGAYRVAKRLQAVVLNSEGRTSGELAGILKAPRSRVSEWLSLHQTHGVEGRLEGSRSGRPPLLTAEQRTPLGELLDRGPVAYGLDTGLWRSPMLAGGIEEECGVAYPPGHVRKLRHSMGFSVQRPRRVLAHLSEPYQKAPTEGGALLVTDAASFRQDSTLHATWSRVGHPPEVPVTGERKSGKILGAIELCGTRFHCRQDPVFHTTT